VNRAGKECRPFERPTGDDAGFTLLEVLVAGFVLVVGLIFIAQFFSSAIGRVTDSETRSLIHQVAAQEIEKARGLDYADVGTVGGHPAGPLLASETVTVEGVSLQISREVTFVEDPSYSGPFPANYRRVTIRVQVDGDTRLGPVELVTLVAGGARGGSLDITVVDTRGEPVPDVLITVDNDHLIPGVHIGTSAIRTDSQGHLLIPGLTPDPTAAYYVEANKTGYNREWTDPMVVVEEGLPYTVIQFIMDSVSTLNIHVVDETGAAVVGASLSVTGPREFATAQTYLTDGTGLASLTGIGFSTSGNPYVIAVAAGNGYLAGSLGDIVLEPGTTQDVTIVVQSDGATSTTDTTLGGTPTTISTTSTTTGLSSLTVHVQRWKNGTLKGLKNAEVTFNGAQGLTNSGGDIVFTDIPIGTYDLLVTRNNYIPYSTTVTIGGGSVTVVVTMVQTTTTTHHH